MEQIEKLTQTWREFLEAYELLKKKHEQFCKDGEGVNLDLAGPGLRTALQLYIHRRRFSHALEDIMYQEYLKGNLVHLTPPVPEEIVEEQPTEEKVIIPPSFAGKKSSKKKDSSTQEKLQEDEA